MTTTASMRAGARARGAGLALLLAVATIAAACGSTPSPAPASPALTSVAPNASAGASAPPPASADPGASLEPAPTDAPPTAPAVAPGDAFVALVGDPAFSATAALSGTRTLARVTTTTTGTLEISGGSWHLVRTATTGAATSTAEAIAVGTSRYAKVGAEWFEGEDAAGAGLVAAVLGTAGAVTNAGRETVDGQELNHLVVDAQDALARSLGLAASGISGVAGSVDVWVADDGTPVHARLAATWTQKVSKKPAKGSATLDLAFSGVGSPVAIAQPDATWAWFVSKRYGYRLAHPSDWEAVAGPKGFLDSIYSPTDATVYANRFKSYGLGLARVVRELRSDPSGFTGFKKVKILANRSARLGALKAQRVTITGTYKAKRYWWIIYVAVKGANIYWVEYRTTVAPTNDDYAMAARIAATHRPA